MDACPQENEVLLLFKKKITEFIKLNTEKRSWTELKNKVV